MNRRLLVHLVPWGAAMAVFAGVAAVLTVIAGFPLAAQTPSGKRNFEGIWNNSTLTPLERPQELAGKALLSPEEAAQYAKRIVDSNNTDLRPTSADTDVVQGYNNFWWDRGTGLAGRRTSLIVDPVDGRIPPLTEAAQKRQAARARAMDHPAGPEDRNLAERCLTRGLPLLPGGYNNNIQIVQTGEYIAIFVETMHDARTIPIDSGSARRPHAPPSVREWLGDSRAHWEGDTLVIDTTNFSPQTNFRGAGAGLHLVERLSLADDKTLQYQFTVDDPSTFTKPWTVVAPWARADGPIFEYACHEGNYSMNGILAGARADEAAALK